MDWFPLQTLITTKLVDKLRVKHCVSLKCKLNLWLLLRVHGYTFWSCWYETGLVNITSSIEFKLEEDWVFKAANPSRSVSDYITGCSLQTDCTSVCMLLSLINNSSWAWSWFYFPCSWIISLAKVQPQQKCHYLYIFFHQLLVCSLACTYSNSFHPCSCICDHSGHFLSCTHRCLEAKAQK